MTTPSLKDRILDANRRMHSLPGYVADYDARNPYMVSALAQREFWRDLRRIRARHDRAASGREALRPPLRALDLGAGTGNLTLKLLRLGYEVTALDLSAAMLERLQAKAHALPVSMRRRLSVTAADAEAFLSASGLAYDAIVMCSFLHHLPDYAEILGLCAMRLSERGVIYFVHEPLPPRRPGAGVRVLTLADRAAFLWREGRLMERLGARLGRNRQTGAGASEDSQINRLTRLADYHVFQRGIEPHVLRRVFTAQGMAHRLCAYTLMNTETATHLARRMGVRDMVKGFGWVRG